MHRCRAPDAAQRAASSAAWCAAEPGPIITTNASVGPGSAERHKESRTASGTRGDGSGDLGADTANAGRGRLLFLDMEAADFGGPADMRAAAELKRDVADLVDRNLVAIAVGEQTDRARGARLLQRHHGALHRQVGVDPLLYHAFDLLDLFRLHGAFEREIEAHALAVDIGPLLPHAVAELGAKRRMQQVRGG